MPASASAGVAVRVLARRVLAVAVAAGRSALLARPHSRFRLQLPHVTRARSSLVSNVRWSAGTFSANARVSSGVISLVPQKHTLPCSAAPRCHVLIVASVCAR
jgi:hypothetical protein